jgi:hypothetical protein
MENGRPTASRCKRPMQKAASSARSRDFQTGSRKTARPARLAKVQGRGWAATPICRLARPWASRTLIVRRLKGPSNQASRGAGTAAMTDCGDTAGQVLGAAAKARSRPRRFRMLAREDEVRVASVWSSLERELHLHRLRSIVRELERVLRPSEGQGRRDERLHIDHALVDIVDRNRELLMKPKRSA